ncbi:MAG: biotin--[acetyl-CoA-carboxylase] ligase [Planctomycetaceae bacterium]
MTDHRHSKSADTDSLVSRVTAETFVRSVEVHDEIGSTNDRALALAGMPGVERPCLIVARRQTAGRGRGANRWWASDGALTFSLLLSLDRDRLPVARWPELSLTIGTSVCRALRPFAAAGDVRLKWPNDVYVAGRKICGILVEIPSAAAEGVVVGVGLNVNNRIEDAPRELHSQATSLHDVVGHPCSPPDVLIAVLKSFEEHLNLLCDEPDQMRALWRAYDLLLGRSVTVGDEHDTVTGTCEGIDDDGALRVRSAAGPRRVYGGVVQRFA